MNNSYQVDPEINFSVETNYIQEQIRMKFYPYTSSPPMLFHYCGSEALLGILSTKHMWFTHIDFFEDYSERKYGVDLLLSHVAEILSKGRLNAKQTYLLGTIKEYYEKAENSGYEKNAFVACFCETADVLSQWERFANKSSGYSLGFDFSKDFYLGYTADNCRRANILKVIYDQNSQNNILQGTLSFLCDYLEGPNSDPSDCMHAFLNTVDSWLFGFKNNFFSEEREWRIIINLFGENADRFEYMNFRNSNGIITPFAKIEFLVPNSKNSSFPLKQVWIGPKSHQIAKDSVAFLLGKYHLGAEVCSSLITLRR